MTVVLLIKNVPMDWFPHFVCDQKFMTLMDRLTKDSYKYVQYGLMHFIDQTNETIPLILLKMHEDLEIIQTTGKIPDNPGMDLVMEKR